MTALQQSYRATLIASLIRMKRTQLDEVAVMIWQALDKGLIDEGEAQALALMVENSRNRPPWQRAGKEGPEDGIKLTLRRPFIR